MKKIFKVKKVIFSDKVSEKSGEFEEQKLLRCERKDKKKFKEIIFYIFLIIFIFIIFIFILNLFGYLLAYSLIGIKNLFPKINLLYFICSILILILIYEFLKKK